MLGGDLFDVLSLHKIECVRNFVFRYLLPLLIAVAVTTLFAVFFQTQRVIALLQELGAEISVGDRVGMTLSDLQGLGPLFALFVLVAFIIAMTVAMFLAQKRPTRSVVLHLLAGTVAIGLMLVLMKKAFFDVQVIAGARDTLGFALQCLAGAMGGGVFYLMRRRIDSPPE